MDLFLSRWLASTIAACWQFSLLFVVIALVARLLRTWLTPAARHVLWSLLLLRLALPFGLEAPFGVAPRPEAWLARLDVAARSFFARSLDRDSTPIASRRSADAPGGPGFVVTPPVTDGADSAAADPGMKSGPIRASRASLAFFVLWICGLIAIAALNVRRARRARRRVLAPIDALSIDVQTALDRAAAALGLRRLPPVAVVDEPAGAIRIAGVFAPRLDLPVRMNRDWSVEELEPVLLHELAHLKRRDPWTRAACNLVQTLFFFHPLVWIAARQVRVERELACDDLAVRQCASGRRGYVEALLRLARDAQGTEIEGSRVLAATGDRGGLRFRLSRLLAEDYRPTLRTSPAVAAGVALAIAVGGGASIYGERPISPTSEREARHAGHAGGDAASVRTPEHVRDALMVLVGGDGREVVDLYVDSMRPFPPTDMPNPPNKRSFYVRPPYLAVLSKPNAPVDLVAVPEGVYSFGLTFDGAGKVSVVDIDAFLPKASAFFAEEDVDPPAVLVHWIERFELEMPAGFDVDLFALGAFADVEVRDGRATLLTRAPAGIDDLRATIARHYRLAPERSLDLMPPPYPDARAALYRFGTPGQARFVPEGATRLSITVDEDGHPNYHSGGFGCGDLRALLFAIGYGWHAVEGDAELLDRELDADLIMRQSAAPATLLAELETALGERLGLEVDLAVSPESRPTIVMRGSLRKLAPDPNSEDGLARIEVHGGTSAGSGMGPAAPMLEHVLARATGMFVVNETTPSFEIVNVSQRPAPFDERNVEEMLRLLADQTGFEISIEDRPSEKVVVSER